MYPRDAVKILLVDDDESIRSPLKEHLEDEGHVVITAADGQQAFRMLRRGERPDVIVLDAMMPVMSGWDFRSAQLSDPDFANIPVVVVSACGFNNRTVLSQFGVAHYVPKPLDTEALLKAITRAAMA
jgi:CheY-like chemotaxis protein